MQAHLSTITGVKITSRQGQVKQKCLLREPTFKTPVDVKNHVPTKTVPSEKRRMDQFFRRGCKYYGHKKHRTVETSWRFLIVEVRHKLFWAIRTLGYTEELIAEHFGLTVAETRAICNRVQSRMEYDLNLKANMLKLIDHLQDGEV